MKHGGEEATLSANTPRKPRLYGAHFWKSVDCGGAASAPLTSKGSRDLRSVSLGEQVPAHYAL